jgi:DNA-directed RNA polymerase subunit RPC12/RpoP
MIDPFLCTRCNAALVVVDAPTIVCRYCGAINEVPAAYRDELRLARDLDQTTRRAIAEWARLDSINVPRWLFVGTVCIPFLLIAGGLAILLALGMLKTMSSTKLARLVAIVVWLPLAPAALLASSIGMRNLLVNGAARIGVAFAAIPSESGELNCRQCGAPLTVEAGDIVVRCLYCEAESIVRLDEAQMRALKTNVGTAKMSLAQAMAALSKRVELASLETRGRVYVIAGLLVLPLVWSFAFAVQSSYWSFFIALDVFVLSVCVFWMMREAFLPRVTVEELDALRTTKENSQNRTAERPAGTRGWYDQAFEGMNFLVPLVVTLMFVAIEAIVLTAR